MDELKMALTEKTYIDKAELLADGQIQVREKRVIMDDGKEVASKFHRYVLDPGMHDLAEVTEKTQGREGVPVLEAVQAIWTPERVNARKAAMAEQAERGPGPGPRR